MDFAIAPYVLEFPDYAKYYAKQSGRMCILDNGFHELGRPLSTAELVTAAREIHPTCIVAPDWLGKPKETLEASVEMLKDRRLAHYTIGVVLCGTSREERASFYEKARSAGCKWLFLPYKEARPVWLMDLAQDFKGTALPSRIHFLGVSTASELIDCRNIAVLHMRISPENLSYDTAKPVKFGLMYKQMAAMPNWRGGGLLDIHASYDDRQYIATLENLLYMRRLFV
jgi:hypothetical protein